MDLGLSADEALIQSTARTFVERELRAHDVTEWFRTGATVQRSLYRSMGSSGWLGMLSPTSSGGGGSTVLECALVYEQLGAAPMPGPLLSSGLIVPLIVSEVGTAEQQSMLMPGICSGEELYALGLSDREVGWGRETVETVAARVDGGIRLTGRKAVVHDAGQVPWLLCAARLDEDVILAMVDLTSDGIAVHQHSGFLASAFEVTLDSVLVPDPLVLGGAGAGDQWGAVERSLQRAFPVVSAYYVGAGQRILDFTVAYADERVLFGQPIGRFQRVQDHIVDLANHVDGSRWITYETIWKSDTGQLRDADIHECITVATRGYYEATNYAHMVFAGIGTDYGHQLMAHSVNARMHYQYLGGPEYHKRRMMDALYPPAGAG